MRTTTPLLLSTSDRMADVSGAASGDTIEALTWVSTVQSTTTVIGTKNTTVMGTKNTTVIGMKNTMVIGAEIGITIIITSTIITTMRIKSGGEAPYRH